MVKVDKSSFEKRIKVLESAMEAANKKGLSDVASEIMRLSSKEVPHDTGRLQNSGMVEPEKDGFIVGYNKVYAARLHEHPEYHFQKGRKGKYLEDPVKNNMKVLLQYYGDTVRGAIK